MLRNARTLWTLALALTTALTGCSGDDLTASDEATANNKNHYDVSEVELAVAAGVSGTIWTLATYDDGSAHPGLNSIDIGATGGSAVHHQINDLPSEIGGGWIFVDFLQEANLCSQFNPGDAKYNGAKLRVYTYFYDLDGRYVGHDTAVYQHVIPAEGVSDAWFKWNNANAGAMWESPDVMLGNRTDGGVYVGNLFSGGGQEITNNNGKLCHYGDHLHQEGMGSRSSLSLNASVEGRVDSAHLFFLDPAVPAIGDAPSAPPAVGSAPPSNNPQDPPADPPQDPQDPPQDEQPADPPKDEQPADPPATSCACKAGVDNFCQYAPKTEGCDVTFGGGYCDPNGDGSYEDADWTAGWYDFHAKCGS